MTPEPTPFRFTPEEKAAMKAQMMAALKPKPKPQPPTATERAQARFAGDRSTEALLQDATAAANAVTRRFTAEEEWLEAERKKREAAQRAFDAEQHRLATDGAQARNYMRAYRQQLEAVSGPVRDYYSMCEQAVQSLHEAQAAMASRISFHKGPGDPDWGM